MARQKLLNLCPYCGPLFNKGPKRCPDFERKFKEGSHCIHNQCLTASFYKPWINLCNHPDPTELLGYKLEEHEVIAHIKRDRRK